MAAKSNVGASGSFSGVPGTASWTAKKLAFPATPDMGSPTELGPNLRIKRSRRCPMTWGLGPWLPLPVARGPARAAGVKAPGCGGLGGEHSFNETRDYAEEGLGNAVVHAHIIDGGARLRKRLGDHCRAR